MTDVYLIWSNKHRMWWGPNCRGYTEKVLSAGLYSRADAIEICNNSLPGTPKGAPLPSVPVLLKDITALTIGGASPAAPAPDHLTNAEPQGERNVCNIR